MMQIESTPGLELQAPPPIPLDVTLSGFITKNGEFISFSERRDGKDPRRAEEEDGESELARAMDLLHRSVSGLCKPVDLNGTPRKRGGHPAEVSQELESHRRTLGDKVGGGQSEVSDWQAAMTRCRFSRDRRQGIHGGEVTESG
eukprot:768341-Hanusia_phi.AAC.2